MAKGKFIYRIARVAEHKHPHPFVAYHMEEFKYHDGLAKANKAALDNAHKEVAEKGSHPDYEHTINRASKAYQTHSDLARAHRHIASQYGKGVEHAFGRYSYGESHLESGDKQTEGSISVMGRHDNSMKSSEFEKQKPHES